jgi:hypothetical protein
VSVGWPPSWRGGPDRPDRVRAVVVLPEPPAQPALWPGCSTQGQHTQHFLSVRPASGLSSCLAMGLAYRGPGVSSAARGSDKEIVRLRSCWSIRPAAGSPKTSAEPERLPTPN